MLWAISMAKTREVTPEAKRQAAGASVLVPDPSEELLQSRK